MSTFTIRVFRKTTIGLLLLLSSLSLSACSLSPTPILPTTQELTHSCLSLVQQAIAPFTFPTSVDPLQSSPHITSISPPNNHHNLAYPQYTTHGTYEAHSGPYDFTCTTTTHPHHKPPTTVLDRPTPWLVGTPITNTQCLSILDAPSSTLMYLAYRHEQDQVADRRMLYHLYECPPDPPSMSVTQDGD